MNWSESELMKRLILRLRMMCEEPSTIIHRLLTDVRFANVPYCEIVNMVNHDSPVRMKSYKQA